MVPLLESKEIQEIDILAVQEPWFNSQNRLKYNPSSSQFHLFYRGEEGIRVC